MNTHRFISSAIAASLLTIAMANDASAWSALEESFNASNTSDARWIISGDAALTSGTIDPVGDGWLRLTSAVSRQRGVAYFNAPIPTQQGLVVLFDYATWGGIGADGLTAFLFDGAIGEPGQPAFRIGGEGGSLGYANRCSRDGMLGGYVGIGIDEFGNFSNDFECRNGGFSGGLLPDAIAIRGPGNASALTDYPYLTGTGTLPESIDCPRSLCPTRPTTLGPGRRQVMIAITPQAGTYSIAVSMRMDDQSDFVQLIQPYTLPTLPPATLKFGYTASTGNSHNYHEIRNLKIAQPQDLSVAVLVPQSAVAIGGVVTYTIAVTNNLDDDVSGAQVEHIPDGVDQITWTCTAAPGSTCPAASGTGPIDEIVDVAGAGSITFTVTGTVTDAAPSVEARASADNNFTEVTPSNNYDSAIIDVALDTDLDGLTDDAEAILGTDPLLADTDLDGLCDGAIDVPGVCVGGEDRNGDGRVDVDESSPLLADTDGDGLDDFIEVIVAGTSPNDADTDDDGLCDGAIEVSGECIAGEDVNANGLLDAGESAPTDPDTDGDGLGDLLEATSATDPALADTDGDGLCDGPADVSGLCVGGEDSNANGTLDPNETDPTVSDTDLDGLDDFTEVMGLTDPANPDSDTDGLCDGSNTIESVCRAGEDVNANGVVDAGETDPTMRDSDFDGLDDALERLGGRTDPTTPDTDGDRLCDGPALMNSVCSGAEDVNQDGITGDDETDPGVSDTDGDGLDDGLEVSGSTDPLDPDTDGDRLCDGPASIPELCVGGEDLDADGEVDDDETDPNNADTDDGGVMDGEEVLDNSTDPRDGLDDSPPAQRPEDPIVPEDPIIIEDPIVITPDEPDPVTQDPEASVEDPGDDNTSDVSSPIIPGDAPDATRRSVAPREGAGEFAYAGGCSTTQPPSGDASMLGLLLLIGGLVARKSRRARLAATIAASAMIIGGAVNAHAQDNGAANLEMQVEGFEPLPGARHHLLNTTTSQTLRRREIVTGVLTHYVRDPMVLLRDGEQVTRVVGDQLKLELGVGVGLFGWSDLHVTLPIIAAQQGTDFTDGQLEPMSGNGLADARFVWHARLLERGQFGLAADVNVHVPTGDASLMASDGAARAGAKLVGDWHHVRRPDLRVAANLGYQQRSAGVARNVLHRDRLTWSVAAGTDTMIPRVRASASIFGQIAPGDFATLVERGGTLTPAPIEATGALTWEATPSWSVGVLGGAGLNNHVGAPGVRAGLELSWRPSLTALTGCAYPVEDFDGFEDDDGCLDPDNDEDGVADIEDICPLQPGPSNLDGCPDEDGDMIADRRDDCPSAPEDLDGFEDDDGCPEAATAIAQESCEDQDPDRDGLTDLMDACPNEAEDRDGFEDDDGCPDLDDDADGIADAVDACPREAETLNQHQDEDGCPDDLPAVVVRDDRLELNERIFFEHDSAHIKRRSHAILREVAQVMKEHPEIEFVVIEGHTDDTGSDSYNRALSEERAREVAMFIVEHGIEPDRLAALGYGESQPLREGEGEFVRALNRRVEFRILQRSDRLRVVDQ